MDDQLRLQKKLTQALSVSCSLDKTLKKTLDIVLQVNNIDCGAIFTFDHKKPEIAIHKGFTSKVIENIQQFLSDKKDDLPFRNNLAVINMSLENKSSLHRFYITGLFPVMHDGKLFAVIIIGSFNTKSLPHWIFSIFENTCLHLGQIMSWHMIKKELNEIKEQNEIAMEIANLGMWRWDLVKNRIYSDDRALELVEFDPEYPDSWDLHVFEEDIEIIDKIDKAIMEGSSEKFMYTYRVKSKTGKTKWIIEIGKTVEWDSNGKPIKALGVLFNDTDRKELELERQKTLKHLEKCVAERTTELEKAYLKLKGKTTDLESTNTALGVLINKREEDKKELEKNYHLNIQKYVLPYVENLSRSNLSSDQKVYLGIINNNLNEIVSPFNRTLESRFSRLTPTELRITNMIKHGKSTKDIAYALKISAKTIENHRHNIRKKLKIHKKPINLHTYLLTIK